MIVQGDVAYAREMAQRFAQFVDWGITGKACLDAMPEKIERVRGARDRVRSVGIPMLRRILDENSTNFALSSDQVDRLIATGRDRLRRNAQCRRLLDSLHGPEGAHGAEPSSPVSIR